MFRLLRVIMILSLVFRILLNLIEKVERELFIRNRDYKYGDVKEVLLRFFNLVVFVLG